MVKNRISIEKDVFICLQTGKSSNQLNCFTSEWNLISSMKCSAIRTWSFLDLAHLFIDFKSHLRSLVIKISITTDPSVNVATNNRPISTFKTFANRKPLANVYPIGFLQSNGNLPISDLISRVQSDVSKVFCLVFPLAWYR